MARTAQNSPKRLLNLDANRFQCSLQKRAPVSGLLTLVFAAAINSWAFPHTATAQSATAQEAAQETVPATAAQNSISEGYTTPAQVWIDEVTASVGQQTSERTLNGYAQIWVADIETRLFDDADNDGYYAGLSISMDIDVEFDQADVFAEIYLHPQGSQPRLLHVTNVFRIYEQASQDRYQVDVGLYENTPAGGYNLLIDVVNAYSGELVDTVSNRTHSNLENLPLESADYQYNDNVDVQVQTSFGVQVSSGTSFNNGVSVGFGVSTASTSVAFRGATGWLGLVGLALAAGLRLRRRHK